MVVFLSGMHSVPRLWEEPLTRLFDTDGAETPPSGYHARVPFILNGPRVDLRDVGRRS